MTSTWRDPIIMPTALQFHFIRALSLTLVTTLKLRLIKLRQKNIIIQSNSARDAQVGTSDHRLDSIGVILKALYTGKITSFVLFRQSDSWHSWCQCSMFPHVCHSCESDKTTVLCISVLYAKEQFFHSRFIKQFFH